VSDQPDNPFNDDKKISALYHAGSTAQPPEHIDQAIRAEAIRSVRTTPRRVRFPWAVPVSMAAVLVLSVSLISLIHEEAPTVSDIRSDIPVIHDEERKKSAASRETSRDQLSIAESTDMAQTDTDTEQKAERQKTTAAKPSSQKSLASAPGLTGTRAEFSSGLKKDLGAKAVENCEQLSHSACLGSEQCSLVVNEMINDPKTFVCRRSTNRCDTGFVQHSDTKESCESRPGCAYISDPCFCPPDVTCICNGGPPPQCHPRKNGTLLQPE